MPGVNEQEAEQKARDNESQYIQELLEKEDDTEDDKK